jgi:hypothetical protein
MQRLWSFLKRLFWRIILSPPVQAIAIGIAMYATGREPFAPVGSYIIVGTLMYIALIGFGDLFRII